ncbi:DNA polymerase III subunit delta' [Metabacillus fastidiosus]|uniref:DNA polymerase III subunit delta n=1 Tax=Metabacillus fastidiosus TaxID=1458 RepID=A0ABU6NUH4_9BACI|nr:DNA polymerase III subunit delta' [Metabacillus fastidiosus]MED4400258.1 DNA polymerase III subunit delta' [Metabacillus fastidiosus]
MSVLALQPRVTSLIRKVFSNDKVAHAYVFSGEPGVGKEEIAFWMAKQFFCKHQNESGPCDDCNECKRINSLNHPDLHVVEPEGQSIKIDQIRSLQKEFFYKGVESNKKCYIIKHVDKMTVQAANSLLKFLEEPNGQTLAILITENKHRIIKTILSRTQMYQFDPLKEENVLSAFVNEGIEREVSFLLSRTTKSILNGKQLLEEDWFFKVRDLFFHTLQQFLENPYGAIITIQTEWPNLFTDKDKQQLSLKLLSLWFNEIVNISLKRDIGLNDKKALLEAYQHHFTVFEAADMMELLIEASGMLRSNSNYLMVLEHICHSWLEYIKR